MLRALCRGSVVGRVLRGQGLGGVRRGHTVMPDPALTPKTCLWCDGDREAHAHFFCKCGDNKILPVDRRCSYFELFGLRKNSFDVDVKHIERTYKELQKKLHPDKFAQTTATEQKLSAQQATYLNVAYDTLTKPLTRALYIMNLKGVCLGNERTISDEALLMEMMEARLAIESAGGNQEALLDLQKEHAGQMDSYCGEIARALDTGNLAKAEDVITRMIYLQRILATIKDKVDVQY